MEIEIPPYLWGKHLYTGIEGSCRSYDERKQCGIKRINIVKMHKWGFPAQQFTQLISNHDDTEEHQETDEMHIGECGDELRNRVIRNNTLQ